MDDSTGRSPRAERVPQARIRIGILLTGFDGGGTQRRLLTLATEFLARGHAVELVVGCKAGPFRRLAPISATVVSLEGALHGIPDLARRKSLRMLAALPALVRYFRTPPIDVLLCGSPPANLAALVARILARSSLPVVLSVNVPLSESTAARDRSSRGRSVRAHLVRRLYPRADGVIANAAFLADDIARFAELSPDRIATIPNPIAVEDIQSGARESATHPWLADASTALVLAVGKLKIQKDFPTLLRAFREVRAVRPARLLVLGAGEHRESLVQLAHSLGLGDDVQFAGFADNPFPYMARADVLVSSSRWEGFSNTLAEALACGCPVVATDCPGGVAELLGGGRFGRLVGIGDFQSMARAVLDTLDAPPDRDRLRDRAAEFSVSRAAESYLGVLRGCLA